MNDRPNGLSFNNTLKLCHIGKSSFYYERVPESELNLTLMRLIDEIYFKYPFFGTRRMLAMLRREGHNINLKRVQRLYRIMDICAVYQKPNLSKPDRSHSIYPYLLKSIVICKPNQVWSTDITYVPMENGFLYKVAFIDWYSRYILSYRISNTIDTDFIIDALTGALNAYGIPEIINTDQGSQFTSAAFIEALKAHEIQISMDGKGRAIDNVRIERYWRSYKYEMVYLHCINDGYQLKALTDEYVLFYNTIRPHQNLNDLTPSEVYHGSLKYNSKIYENA